MAPNNEIKDKLTKQNSTKTLGAYSASIRNGTIRGEEFIPAIKGRKAIKKFREIAQHA